SSPVIKPPGIGHSVNLTGCNPRAQRSARSTQLGYHVFLKEADSSLIPRLSSKATWLCSTSCIAPTCSGLTGYYSSQSVKRADAPVDDNNENFMWYSG
ncbi:hypothetical protein TOPH_05314, partial [Tolypocladium ophioglossoides CBS 100239]